MYNFNYYSATSVADAIEKMKAAEDAVAVAGGMTLIATLKQRLASPTDIIDLNNIAELREISVNGREVSIGAMATHDSIARSEAIEGVCPSLTKLVSVVGDPQVRNRGTIGGAISNNDPASDYPAGIVGLNATVHTDHRAIPADDFFTDMFETALEFPELVTKITFTAPEIAAYRKFANPASRYAIVGVFVSRNEGEVRVAVTGAGPCVFRVPAMEEALAKDFRPEAIEGITIPHDNLNADIHASTEYRAHLVGVMARRAVADAIA